MSKKNQDTRTRDFIGVLTVGHTSNHDSTERSCQNSTRNPSINMLNDYCLDHIFSYLSGKELIGIERVSKRWRKIASDSWRRITTIKFNDFFPELADYHEYKYDKDIRSDENLSIKRLIVVLTKCGSHISSLQVPNNIYSYFKDQIVKLIGEYCTNLMSLDVSNNNLTKEEMAVLAEKVARNLKELNLNWCQSISDESLSEMLSAAVNLESLSVTQALTIRKSLLNLCEKCKLLKINGDLIEGHSTMLINALKRLKNLESLGIRGIRFDYGAETTTQIFQNLRTLDISSQSQLDDWVLARLPNLCPLLEELNISDCENVTADAIGKLIKLPKLVTLKMNRLDYVNSDLLVHLAHKHTGSFKNVHCSQCKNLDDQGPLKIMCHHLELASIDVSYCNISKVFIQKALVTVKFRTNDVILTIGIELNNSKRSEIKKHKHPLLHFIDGPLTADRSDYEHGCVQYTDFDVNNVQVNKYIRTWTEMKESIYYGVPDDSDDEDDCPHGVPYNTGCCYNFSRYLVVQDD